MAGEIYMVATPIGNMEDITARAIRILGETDYILSEDTRVSGELLKRFGIEKRIVRYDQHSFRNELLKAQIATDLIAGKRLALITDAGTPGVSDPGNELLSYLYNSIEDLKVTPIPGASAVSSAISVCGFDMSFYVFTGFVPKKKKTKFYKRLQEVNAPFVFFESPHRIKKTIEEMQTYFPEAQYLIAREVTKLHETIYRGTAQEILSKLPEVVKGEIVGITCP